jgi:V8-like Glu-specific endopeptidase
MFQSIISCLVAVALLTPQLPVVEPAPLLLKRTNPSIGVVEWEDKENAQFCTGFAVGIVWFITAEHCVREGVDITVDGVPARLIKKNTMLALLEIPEGKYRVLNIRKDRPKVGDEIRIVGFIYGMPEMTLTRHVAGFCACDYGDDENLLSDSEAGGGMSGAPVLDNKGEVVGLHQASKGVIGFSTTSKEIREFLK